MNPVLYDKNTNDFSNLGLGTLGEAISCVVSEKINNYFTLELEYPEDGEYADLLVVDNIIAASVKGYSVRQLFRITRVEKRFSVIQISAEHISYQLKSIMVAPYTASSASGAFAGILSNSINTNPFDFTCYVSKSADFELETPTSARGVLFGENGIVSTYGGEVTFNNYHVRIDSQRGGTADTSFEYGKNIVELTNTISIEELVTSICPFYYKEGTFIMLSEGVLDCSTASNYSYKRVIPVDMTSSFGTGETPSEALLRTKATAYLNGLAIGFPTNGIDVTPILLSSFGEKFPENIGMGDSVVVSYAPLGISYTDRITAYDWDVIMERYASVTIGDDGKSFVDYVLEGGTTYVGGGGGGGGVQIIDSAMSDSSSNAVMNKVIKAYVDGQLATKVDKVTGKDLSENNFTNTLLSKLNGIESGAQVNQNAFSRVTVGTTNMDADSASDAFTVIAGANVQLTPDAANDSLTIDAYATLAPTGVTPGLYGSTDGTALNVTIPYFTVDQYGCLTYAGSNNFNVIRQLNSQGSIAAGNTSTSMTFTEGTWFDVKGYTDDGKGVKTALAHGVDYTYSWYYTQYGSVLTIVLTQALSRTAYFNVYGNVYGASK